MTFTQNQSITCVKQPINAKITSNNTTNAVVYTAGASGSKIVGFSATSNGAAAVACSLQILNGGVLYLLGTASIGADAGANTVTAGVNLLPSIAGLPVDADGNSYLNLISGDQLQITLGTAIASPNLATFFCSGGDF